MKKKLFLCVALLLACVFLMCACGDDGVPEGYRLASDADKDGFCLYVPDAWESNRSAGVLMVSPSSLNTAILTVAHLDAAETDIDTYWAAEEEKLREDFSDYALATGYPKEEMVSERVTYVYEYTGSRVGLIYRFRQYLILKNGTDLTSGMCALTFSASDMPSEVTGDVDFVTYDEQMRDVVGYFKLTTGEPQSNGDLAVTDDPNAPEGMKRANRFEHLGMDIYVPNDWTVNLSDGFVGASTEDGANIGVTAIDMTASVAGAGKTLQERMEYYGIEMYNAERGFLLIDYWNLLKAEYADYYADNTFTVTEEPIFTEEDGKIITTPTPTVTGATTYYRFAFEGTKYGVKYQVTLYIFRETNDRNNTFRTLTYTTLDGMQEAHRAEVERILQEVKY